VTCSVLPEPAGQFITDSDRRVVHAAREAYRLYEDAQGGESSET
jgi:hypothetical protein